MCIHEETNQADHAVSSYERGARRPLIRGATSKVDPRASAAARDCRNLARSPPRYCRGRTRRELRANSRRRCWRSARPESATGFGEVDPGRIGIAAPLFDSHGRIAGSISIVLQTPRASEVVMSRLKAALVNAAREIERMRDGERAAEITGMRKGSRP